MTVGKQTLHRALFEVSLTTLGAYWTVRDVSYQARVLARDVRRTAEWAVFWARAMGGK